MRPNEREIGTGARWDAEGLISCLHIWCRSAVMVGGTLDRLLGGRACEAWVWEDGLWERGCRNVDDV